ncbi:MAG: hypothetical protein GKR85_07765 [Candidatus Nanopelagicales bacterium]|nr:hypothetical protein [Candidatus Nanopelagicales bacterium]
MTGLIYVVIIALWAAVLIPIWLRRHDQISEVRSTARFSSAMKSLGKNEKSGRSARRGSSSGRPTSPAQEAVAKRRAVVMGVLSAALAVVLALAVVGLIPRLAPIVLAVVVLTYVIAASMTSSRRSAGADRRSMADDESLEYGIDEYDDEYDVEFDSEFEDDYREVAYTNRVADVAYPRSRGTGPTSKRVRDAQMAAAMDDYLSWDPWEGEQSEEGWSAVPTTLPTYVNAPRATRVRRPIERDRDWSGQAMVEVARTMRRPRITVDDLEDDRYELRSTPHDVASSEDTAELPSLGYEETRRAAGE